MAAADAVSCVLPDDAPEKRFVAGTHRTCVPAETLARVRPMMAAMGITRIADVTGLDRVGIPVAMAVRPNSRSVSVSQGKGMSAEAAKASALMESVETYHAEQPCVPVVTESRNRLAAADRVIDTDGLPRSVDGAFDEDLPIRWMRGRDLVGGDDIWVPAELVHTDYTLPGPDTDLCFSASTNGLASGNHLLEAVVHGLCEVVERDATTLWQLGVAATRRETGLDLATVDDAGCRRLVDRFDAAGLDVRVWDATADVGVATFYCLAMDRDREGAIAEFGAGAHPSRRVALARALTEAAQARLTYVAGSRDDFDPGWYAETGRRARAAACRQLLDEHVPARRFAEVPHAGLATFAEDVAYLLERLAGAGIGEIGVIDLTREALEIPVVRVVVPGLEGPYRGERSDYVPGARALALLDEILA